jgi:hypothetical protein
MSNIRDTSQQDRRVYVGNLSYDVKWHHLKDFMRQGTSAVDTGILASPGMLGADDSLQLERFSTPTFCFFLMECRRWAFTSDFGWLIPRFPFSWFLMDLLD